MGNCHIKYCTNMNMEVFILVFAVDAYYIIPERNSTSTFNKHIRK